MERNRCATVGTMVVAIAMIVGLVLAVRPRTLKEKNREFLGELEKRMDPERLRAWAIETIAQEYQGQPVLQELDYLPSWLFTSDGPPRTLYIDRDPDTGLRYLVLQWGGGFGHHGITVGESPSYVERSDDIVDMWEPGIFVWQEVQ